MARLIDQEYDSAGNLINVTIEDDGYIVEMIREKRGQWIDRGDYVTTAYGSLDIKVCSNCNAEVTIDQHDHFCPNCGAKMM